MPKTNSTRLGHSTERGFSLIELTVVLLIITLLASVAVRSTNELGFQVRHEQTKERLELIKQAIIGNPNRTINGQPNILGFVADMGRLPTCLRELVENYNCTTAAANPNGTTDTLTKLWAGWRGPYLSLSGNPADADAFSDGWGNVSANGNYGWHFDNSGAPNLILHSLGKNQQSGAGDTGYDEDYPASQPTLTTVDWRVDVSSITANVQAGPLVLTTTGTCSDTNHTTKTNCADNGKIWTESTTDPITQDLCLNLYYRTAGGINRIESAPASIAEDGRTHSLSFNDMGGCSDLSYKSKVACEANGKIWAAPLAVPIGQAAIDIRKSDGDCDPSDTANNPLYPATQNGPIPIVISPKKPLLTILTW